jgi:hypothetical protein
MRWKSQELFKLIEIWGFSWVTWFPWIPCVIWFPWSFFEFLQLFEFIGFRVFLEFLPSLLCLANRFSLLSRFEFYNSSNFPFHGIRTYLFLSSFSCMKKLKNWLLNSIVSKAKWTPLNSTICLTDRTWKGKLRTLVKLASRQNKNSILAYKYRLLKVKINERKKKKTLHQIDSFPSHFMRRRRIKV